MEQPMKHDLNNLIRLKKADIKAGGEMLARAFQDYPLMEYFVPDGNKRKRKLPGVFRMQVRHGLKYGEVYATSTKIEGVAIWFPHHSPHDAWWSNFISGRFLVPFIVGMETMKRQQAFGAYAGGVRKRVVSFPHWYLQVLGVDPEYRGQGVASRLLKPMFDRIDKEGLPCFLETQAERNVALYEHLGFRVAEEGTIPGSDIRSWAMLRGKVD
jgi:ribosomal protein S18 acetylase RimI-like enzyme